MELLFASRPSHNDHRQHVFFFKWERYSRDKNTWETYQVIMESRKELLNKYYEKNPVLERDGCFIK